MSTTVSVTSVVQAKSDYQPGQYVACLYDGEWYIGNIIESSEENMDFHVKFMRRRRNLLTWPAESARDQCWVPLTHILCTIDAPDVYGRGGRQYKLSAKDMKQMTCLPK